MLMSTKDLSCAQRSISTKGRVSMKLWMLMLRRKESTVLSLLLEMFDHVLETVRLQSQILSQSCVRTPHESNVDTAMSMYIRFNQLLAIRPPAEVGRKYKIASDLGQVIPPSQIGEKIMDTPVQLFYSRNPRCFRGCHELSTRTNSQMSHPTRTCCCS